MRGGAIRLDLPIRPRENRNQGISAASRSPPEKHSGSRWILPCFPLLNDAMKSGNPGNCSEGPLRSWALDRCHIPRKNSFGEGARETPPLLCL
jgi:hypothetical protein